MYRYLGNHSSLFFFFQKKVPQNRLNDQTRVCAMPTVCVKVERRIAPCYCLFMSIYLFDYKLTIPRVKLLELTTISKVQRIIERKPKRGRQDHKVLYFV